MTTEVLPASPAEARTSPGGPVVGWLVGLLSVAVGLLPWLLRPARLPLQNLWTTQTLPDDMPVALLPLSQYDVSTIAALLIVGGTVAGLGARILVRQGRATAAPVLLGVATGQVVAICQSFAALHEGLRLGDVSDSRSRLYWLGMLTGTVLVAVLALVATWLLSRRSVTLAALGAALVAVPLGSWVGVWLATIGGASGPAQATGQIVRWLPAVVVALALAWCGSGSPGRVAVWVATAFVLWAAPLGIIAATNALGTRAFRGDPAETIDQGLAVLRSAAASGITVAPTVWALVGAAVLTGIRAMARRR